MPDFTEILRDDFNGTSLNRDIWKAVYSGQYGTGMFRWDPSQLEVGNGKLTIATEREGGQWFSGGLSQIPDGQTYGSYEFRARIDAAQGTASVILLWPSSNQWTDEVNIVETNRPDRQQFAFTNHGTPWETQYVDVNLTDWHVFRLDWTPGSLKLYVDGALRGSMTNDIPDQPMSFGMQGHVLAASEWWFGGAPDASTPSRVATDIDWVRISAWTPGAGTDVAAPASAPAAAPPAPVAAAPAPVAVIEAAASDWSVAAASEAQATAPVPAPVDPSDPYAAFRSDGGSINWDAVAARVNANFEATGQWFL